MNVLQDTEEEKSKPGVSQKTVNAMQVTNKA